MGDKISLNLSAIWEIFSWKKILKKQQKALSIKGASWYNEVEKSLLFWNVHIYEPSKRPIIGGDVLWKKIPNNLVG
ncbi:hypothetical protein STRDD12_00804 [Streptococcus sp. DD12]|nr:hypothetical protein STRDD12_00804 [Streptococcus sp. DD12]